jgi:ABC-2 type transport system permease protein
MLRTVYSKALRDQRRALLGWGIGIALLMSIMAAIWPSFRDMPDVEQFLANYPEEMRELFNIETMTTGTGYFNAELYSMLLPILFIIFGIGRGARAIAGEEEAGTLDVLLVTRVSPATLVVQQAAALAAGVAVLGAVLFLSTMAMSAAFDMGVGLGAAATGAVAMVLLGIEFGWLALAIGAATGRRAWAIAIPAIFAVGGYVLYLVGQLVESVEPWMPLSPFYQAIEGGPLGAGLPVAYIWLVLPALVVLVPAAMWFNRRDITVH